MPSKTDDRSRNTRSGKKAYPMNLSRLGNAIILNNVAGWMPESIKDVAALKDMLDTIGFDVHTYEDCDEKKLKQIWTWMMTEESHAYCNAFFLVFLCQATDEWNLLDSCGQIFSSTVRVTDDVHSIKNLNRKPKIILIQRYTEYEVTEVKIPELTGKSDIFITYNQRSTCRYGEDGSDYLQGFAKHMKEEYMKTSLVQIVRKVDQLKDKLTDAKLMELAVKISVAHLQSIAIADMGITSDEIKNIYAEKRKIQLSNFEVLRRWGNLPGNTKEKLAALMIKSGLVAEDTVKQILQSEPKEISKQQNCLQMELYFSDFHKVEREVMQKLDKQVEDLQQKITKNENDTKEYVKKIDTLREEKKEKDKIIKELEMIVQKDKKDQEEKLELTRKDCEGQLKEDQEEIAHLQETIKHVTAEEVKYTQDIQDLRERCAKEKAKEEETLSEIVKCMEEAQTLLKWRTTSQNENEATGQHVQEHNGKTSQISDIENDEEIVSQDVKGTNGTEQKKYILDETMGIDYLEHDDNIWYQMDIIIVFLTCITLVLWLASIYI